MRNWTFAVFVFLELFCVAFSHLSFPEPFCPPSGDIYPCFCTSDYDEASISCEKIRGIDRLEPVLKNTRGMNISYIFYQSKLGDIPSDFFKGQKSEHLDFTECKIGSFGDRPFNGLEDTLNYLSVDASIDKREKDLEIFPLGHLKKLQHLSFTGNDIKRLGNDWFNGGPAALRILMLEANDIEEVGDRAFSSLVNVEQIWMGENRFRKVSRTMFPRPANKLHTLEMSFSEIEELPEDIFEDMPALKAINVSGNKLKSVPEATWGRVWDQLQEVYLQRNRGLQCDENLKWIYKRKLPKILNGQCTDEKHYGKNIADLKLSDFE